MQNLFVIAGAWAGNRAGPPQGGYGSGDYGNPSNGSYGGGGSQGGYGGGPQNSPWLQQSRQAQQQMQQAWNSPGTYVCRIIIMLQSFTLFFVGCTIHAFWRLDLDVQVEVKSVRAETNSNTYLCNYLSVPAFGNGGGGGGGSSWGGNQPQQNAWTGGPGNWACKLYCNSLYNMQKAQ